ncbi:MAG: YraN family protein [Desulfovibrio sp.]|jgi:putative endonuclease|nr:YraN family protein [Desulfovibrio sp.]
MTEKNAHLELGRAGEKAAEAFLVRQGFRILHRNWRPQGARSGLELDLVTARGDALVFVEVKTRALPAPPEASASVSFGGDCEGIPLYASFTENKRRRLAQAARLYLSAHALWDRPCRFDLVLVGRDPRGFFHPEQHCNVIELRHPVGGGDTAWQPW